MSVVQLSDGWWASASGDNTIKIWNVASGDCVATLTGHTAAVSCLVKLRDGRLASASDDKSIKVWRSIENNNNKKIKWGGGFSEKEGHVFLMV